MVAAWLEKLGIDGLIIDWGCLAETECVANQCECGVGSFTRQSTNLLTSKSDISYMLGLYGLTCLEHMISFMLLAVFRIRAKCSAAYL